MVGKGECGACVVGMVGWVGEISYLLRVQIPKYPFPSSCSDAPSARGSSQASNNGRRYAAGLNLKILSAASWPLLAPGPRMQREAVCSQRNSQDEFFDAVFRCFHPELMFWMET